MPLRADFTELYFILSLCLFTVGNDPMTVHQVLIDMGKYQNNSYIFVRY